MQLLNKFIPISRHFANPLSSDNVGIENNLDNYLFVANDVRNIMVLFTLYFPNDNTWVSCLVVYKLNLANRYFTNRFNYAR